jgi:hypothetical protein
MLISLLRLLLLMMMAVAAVDYNTVMLVLAVASI